MLNKIFKSSLILVIALVALFNIGCSDKLDLAVFDSNKGNVNVGGDTVYVKLSPDWGGFKNPQAIAIGHDVFIYVADTDNDRIVMMNLNGDVLGSRTIKKPISVTQDYQLNLIVCGKYETTVGGVNTSVSAVYKLDMYASGHNISTAPLTMLLPQPGSQLTSQDLRVDYTSACVLYDNSVIIGRKGPNNTSIISPDNSLMLFQKVTSTDGTKKDSLIGRLPLFEPLGTGLKSVNNISSLTAFPKRNQDFIMTLTGDNSFKAQWMTYVITSTDETYMSKLSPSLGTPFVTPGKFNTPTGVTVDNAGNMFVVDAVKDSVYKFNSLGDQLQGWGGPSVFGKAVSVAYNDRIVYVVDAVNNKIVRFTLSTELQ